MSEAPDYLISWCLKKIVPTDMDWHGSLDGGYAHVSMTHSIVHLDWTVSVFGNDDTCLVTRFNTYEDALSLFNKLNYIQSDLDLKEFESNRSLSNGRPHNRTKFTLEWYDAQQDVG